MKDEKSKRIKNVKFMRLSASALHITHCADVFTSHCDRVGTLAKGGLGGVRGVGVLGMGGGGLMLGAHLWTATALH